jgi:N-acetylmuramoyl-L-alanine amidase
MSKPKYLLDPGHGGADSGAVGSALKEKDVVLDVALRMRDLLLADGRIDVSMSRTSDVFHSLAARAQMANVRGAALVSIHANAGGGTGFEAFTTPGNTGASDKLATAMLKSYAAAFSSRIPGRYDMSDGDPDKEARFTVLTSTQGPAVLFELAFVDRKVDHDLMAQGPVRAEMAYALADGILKHEFGTGLVGPVTPPPVEPPSPPASDAEVARLRAIIAEAKLKVLALQALLDKA